MLSFFPVTGLDQSDLRTLSHGIHHTVQSKDVAAELEDRYLFGVLARHSVSPGQSLAVMQRAQDQMAEGTNETFVIYSAATEGAIGQATIMPDLQLTKRPTSLPLLLPNDFRGFVAHPKRFRGSVPTLLRGQLPLIRMPPGTYLEMRINLCGNGDKANLSGL